MALLSFGLCFSSSNKMRLFSRKWHTLFYFMSEQNIICMDTIFSLSSHVLMDSQDHFIMTSLLQMVSQASLWSIDLEYFIHVLISGIAGQCLGLLF